MTTINKNVFEEEISWIRNPLIQQFALKAVGMLPDYFFTVAASSTGKYHPSYALGAGGLVRHTKAAVKIAHELLGLDMYKRAYSSDQQDLMLVALMLHDGWKHGPDATPGSFTVAEHPTVCATWIRQSELSRLLPEDQIDFLCGCIESHMGQWNTDYRSKKAILPIPKTPAQKFVHQADYLASRKYLIFDFGDSYYEPEDDSQPTSEPEKDRNLESKIAGIVDICKKLIESGVSRDDVYRIVSENNGGNRNPNSIKEVEVADTIKKKLEELQN